MNGTKTITIRYGLNMQTREVDLDATVRSVVGDPNNKAYFGYGDNVRAMIDGVEISANAVIPQGATLTLETACNQKA